jgi:hypothetical protein
VRARLLRIRDRLAVVSRALAAPPPPANHAEVDAGPARCTGLTARWCPIHGDCSCDEVEGLDGSACPLHAFGSNHVEGEIDPLAALAAEAREPAEGVIAETIRWLEETHAADGDEGAIEILARLRAVAPPQPSDEQMEAGPFCPACGSSVYCGGCGRALTVTDLAALRAALAATPDARPDPSNCAHVWDGFGTCERCGLVVQREPLVSCVSPRNLTAEARLAAPSHDAKE